ncbi:hypothetical protein A2U01_0035033, partial [Trifolium medium]|nr:hypothetical protein [Trifolium medium]
KKGVENVVADHLSRLDNATITAKEKSITEEFPDERLFAISQRPWFANMANFKASNVVPREYTWQQKKKLFRDAKHYWWDDPYLYKEGTDGVMIRCVSGAEVRSIMWHCHSSDYGGHHSGNRTAVKILHCGFLWPTLFHDCNQFVRNCDKCQRT